MTQSEQIYHLILIGPPGSGKSTIAEHLLPHLPLAIVATGAGLRNEVASNSDIGQAVQQRLAQGQLVPDDIINQLIRQWLREVQPDQGFLLDGYPRSLEQAHMLDQILADLQRPLHGVIALELSQEMIIERLTGRRICEVDGDRQTLHISDAQAVQRCQERGGRLVQRPDDQPHVVKKRMHVYAQETQPLLDHYAQRGLLRQVSAADTPEHIVQRILDVLG